MIILRTSRLYLSKINKKDAPFLYQLMNDPDWILNIGDRQINNLEDAEKFIANRFIKSYKENEFGFYILRLIEDDNPIGICGLIKRDGLDNVDIGYALIPEFRGNGYAFEAAKVVYAYGVNHFKLDKIVAIVNPGNKKSAQILEKLGLQFEKMITLPNETKEIQLFSPS